MSWFSVHLDKYVETLSSATRTLFSTKDLECQIFNVGRTVDYSISGAYPGFLERGFICIKVCGFALLILFHFFKYPLKMK